MKGFRSVAFMVILIILEAYLSTIKLGFLGSYASPIVYLLVGVAMGILLLRSGKNVLIPSSSSSKDVVANTSIAKINYLAFFTGLCLLWIYAGREYQSLLITHTGIDKIGSDIIPQIMLFVKRFVNGVFPYQPMPFPEMRYTLIPTYLPMQWMPYIPAELLGFDYRFIALGMCTIAFIVWMKQLQDIPYQKWIKLFISLIPIWIFYEYMHNPIINFRVTIEYNVAAYYILLGIALYKKNTWAIGLSLILCILSRYSLAIWLPLLGVLGWYYMGRKDFIKVFSIVLVGMVVLYLPFFFKDPLLFKKGYDYYAQASIDEWTIQDWQNIKDKYPFHMTFGLGFANYAYEFISGDVTRKIAIYQNIHIIMCLLTIAGLLLYWYKNRKAYSFEVFTIASMKIYLTVFYSFVVIPYAYLYILPTFFSFVLLLLLLRIEYLKQKNESICHT